MDLPYEYFKSKSHITALQRLKDRELYYIIRLFQGELKDFNKAEGFYLTGLSKACIKMKDLIKDIRFILDGYEDVIFEHELIQCDKKEINNILTGLDKIEYELKKIKAVRILKNKVNDLVESCLLKIRGLYATLCEFIYNESRLWDSDFLKNLI